MNNSRVYLHAVIDIYSRKILAWCADSTFRTEATSELLVRAGKLLKGEQTPQVYMDSGIENKNSSVTSLVESGIIERVLAQVDVRYSNSMIEAWWRLVKHQWLFINPLDTLETVRKLIGFFVREYNESIPHSAFDGQTSYEM